MCHGNLHLNLSQSSLILTLVCCVGLDLTWKMFLSLRNLLGNKADLQSDGEDGDDDDDCFVPAKIDLQSSSDEEEEAKIDSEDELVVKRRRGSRTPRSAAKTRASARTPCKTPSKKVSQICSLLDAFCIKILLSK